MSDCEGKMADQDSHLWRVKIDERVSRLEIAAAVDGERHKSVIKRLDKIDGHVSKLVYLMAGGIITAFTAFIINGGLKIGG